MIIVLNQRHFKLKLKLGNCQIRFVIVLKKTKLGTYKIRVSIRAAKELT